VTATTPTLQQRFKAETSRIAQVFCTQQIRFAISLRAISKALSSLDEQLWMRRQGSSVVVLEPRRLLLEWAEKYKERYRWRLRSSFDRRALHRSRHSATAIGKARLVETPG
jgi:hypothetical protein